MTIAEILADFGVLSLILTFVVGFLVSMWLVGVNAWLTLISAVLAIFFVGPEWWNGSYYFSDIILHWLYINMALALVGTKQGWVLITSICFGAWLAGKAKG